MKTHHRAMPTHVTSLIELEPRRLPRRTRGRRGPSARGPRPRRMPHVVGRRSNEPLPITPLTASAFAPEDFVHPDAPLVCELAPMADVELGEEPFPVFPWILAGLYGDLE